MVIVLDNFIGIIICLFYIFFSAFLIFPFAIGKTWNEDYSVEENIKKLKKYLFIWFMIFFVLVIFLVLAAIL